MMSHRYDCDLCGACCRGTLIVEAYCLAASRSCRFLSAEGRCTIYPTRPNACVAMQAGDEQCQEARGQLGLPPLEPLQPSESRAQDAPRV